MLNLLFPSYEGKRYIIRDVCSGTRKRYKYNESVNSHLSLQQHKKCLDALSIDIETKQTPVSNAPKITDRLDLDLYQHRRGRVKTISHAFTFKEYMELSLYDSKIGYYTTNPGIGKDFRTKPMLHSPYYGMWISELLFQWWVKMIDDHSIHISDPFQIIEGGGGTGIFARDIINYAATRCEKEESLRTKFYDNLFYLIIEISPELVEKQKENLSKWENKCSIICGDIRNLNKYTTEKLASNGFFISNELPDAFSMYKVRRKDSKLQTSIVFPVLNDLSLTNEKIKKFDELVRQFLPLREGTQPKGHFLSKDLYRELSKNLSQDQIRKGFSWKELWINAKKIDEIRKFIPSHTSFIGKMKNNREYALNTDLHFFQKTTSKLIKVGYKITIDYQEDNKTIINDKNPFRCYPGGINHHFRIMPGTNDMTADVNASSLAEEGIRAGWKPLFFGTEKVLLGIGSYDTIKNLAKKRMNFKVVIENKKGKNPENSVPFCSQPLTYRDLFLKKCDILPKIFRGVLGTGEHNIAMIAHNLYSALIELQLDETKKTGIREKEALEQLYNRIQPIESNMKKAIKLAFKSFLGKKSLFLTAKEYDSLNGFNLKNIAFIFNQTKTSDEEDYLAFLLIRQILQMYFY
ncbi:MAG: SAM-dependent methyltransferase, partial [Chlamydiota bacterium]